MSIDFVHYTTSGVGRDEIIDTIGGTIIDSFIVDNGHPSGAEIHSVTNTGIIIIQSQRTQQVITRIIARPEQIRRLYRQNGKKAPRSVIRNAYIHNELRYNDL